LLIDFFLNTFQNSKKISIEFQIFDKMGA